MPPQAVSIVLRDGAGVEGGQLVIADLPRSVAIAPDADGALALREGATYRFAVEGLAGQVRLEPSELFDPDDDTGRQGRLRPGQAVGRLVVVAEEAATGREFRGAVNIEPMKLEQAREYRQMLEDIAGHAAESLLQGFAPTALNLTPDRCSAELLYQRFAVLEARLRGEGFPAAMGRILHQPDRTWEPHLESRPAGTSYPSGSSFGRALAAPGPRQLWPGGRRQALATVPRHLTRVRHESTVDTAPNRFVKYALERWRDIAVQLLDALERAGGPTTPGPVKRGRAAAVAVIAQLDELLAHDMFRGVGHLQSIPTGSQVLLKREGYRELFRTFALVEAGPALTFDRPAFDDIYNASQRNVATLYEFWCFLVLTEAVGRVCGETKTSHAFAATNDGLSLTLRTGAATALQWQVERHGRTLAVELFFNRQFSVVRGGGNRDGSWSRAMRPDCSLHVRPKSGLPRRSGDTDLDVWIHFDAKYRIEHLAEQLTPVAPQGESEEAADAEEAESHARSKREDLLKMHAYRDAIHRTAGAYVLYPGDHPFRVERFTELLPGLGAFPLRPGPGGSAHGSEALESFVSDVLTHLSAQASEHERDRFWSARINTGRPSAPRRRTSVPFLDSPPADTDVLVGYVRNAQHRAWIERTRTYNVRADGRAGAVSMASRELGADLLLLYQPTRPGLQIVTLALSTAWRAVDRQALLRTGYPQPGGDLYFVTAFEPLVDAPEWLRQIDVDRLLPKTHAIGAPFVVTWWDLLASSR